ncbi:MAG: hypothetical protein KF894_08885 [Labilithrix sp.]|nr:hypothetical protein [Labilithrix sp.]
MSADWTEKTTWMREVRAVKASFSESGALLSVELEPAIPAATDEDQKEDPAKARQRLEDERRRRVFGAVGGLVKRHEPAE